VAGDMVASTANGDIQAILAREGDCRRNISRVCAPHNHRGSAINHGIPYSASVFITRIPWNQYRAFYLASQAIRIHVQSTCHLTPLRFQASLISTIKKEM
jgi:hypothetical protein